MPDQMPEALSPSSGHIAQQQILMITTKRTRDHSGFAAPQMFDPDSLALQVHTDEFAGAKTPATYGRSSSEWALRIRFHPAPRDLPSSGDPGTPFTSCCQSSFPEWASTQ